MSYVILNPDECKGCRLCIEACSRHCLSIGSGINRLGYQYALFEQRKCTACGMCYYACPEPGTITVVKEDQEEKKVPPSDETTP